MRRYETTIIADPDLHEEDRSALFDRVKEIIAQQQGVLIEEDFWGAKKLAYEIKKKTRGYYARYDFCGTGPLVAEMERFFRIDDRIMKYLTILLNADADVEKIQAELASAHQTKSEQADQTDSRPEAEATPADTDGAVAETQEIDTPEEQPEEE